MYRYDFNGLYTFVRLKYDYPVGEPKEIGNPPVGDLEELFGLIKAILYSDGSMPLGIPCRIGKDFNRLKGRVLFKGTTEELKNLIKLGARVERIEKVLHYDKKREGDEIWGKSIGEFERIKRDGEKTKNKGKRMFGKIGNNSS
jgi:hypothetical protein